MGILSKLLRRAPPESFSEPEQVLPEELERFRSPHPSEPMSMKDREFHTFARKFVSEKSPEPAEHPDFPPIGAPVTIEEAFHKELQEKQPERPDKLDLIISKLETIDERLKVVEERLARRVV